MDCFDSNVYLLDFLFNSSEKAIDRDNETSLSLVDHHTLHLVERPTAKCASGVVRGPSVVSFHKKGSYSNLPIDRKEESETEYEADWKRQNEEYASIINV